MERREAGKKVASWLAVGPIGYVALGRGKTRKTKAKRRYIVQGMSFHTM